MSAARVVHEVDPARFAPGRWCHEHDAEIGEGDIAGSYSADKIAMQDAVRKPFRWNGALHVSTGSFRHSELVVHEAYRLVDASVFEGSSTTYVEKTKDCQAARNDPLGFYHGMTVRQGGKQWVMCGPPIGFKAGPQPQADLCHQEEHYSADVVRQHPVQHSDQRRTNERVRDMRPPIEAPEFLAESSAAPFSRNRFPR